MEVRLLPSLQNPFPQKPEPAVENLDKSKDVFHQGDHLRETDVIASLREHIRICPSPGIEMTYHRLKILV